MKIYSAQLKGTTTVATGSNVSLTGSFSGSIAGIDINANNTFTQSASSRLTNIESKSASVDISISNINSITASNLARLSNLETKSSSVDISITNINSVTASNIARLSNLESKSASVDISISNINQYTGSNNTKWTTLTNVTSSLIAATGSYATTGSNSFYGTQVFSGSVYIANDLIVQGSSSIQYISASSVSIGTNIVQLNTANPSVRFAGLTIIDSGSIGGSGSFLYDSVHDEFVFVHRGNGTNVTSSHFVLGPETYDSLGNETYLTNNRLPKGTGKEHLVDSCIQDSNGTVTITGTLCTSGIICSTNLEIKQSSNNRLVIDCVNTANEPRISSLDSSNNPQYLTINSYDLKINTNGSRRLFIDSNGISCFSGSVCMNRLYVENSAGQASIFRQTDATSYSSLRLYNDQGTGARALEIDYMGSSYSGGERAEIFVTGAYPLLLGTSNTCRMFISNTGITSFTCQICAPQYITTQGSSVSYAAETNYTIWNSEIESCIQDSNNPAAYTRIKTWIADRSGCATIRYTGYIQSGPTYWGYRVTRNGTSSYMCVAWDQCIQSGCASANVHGYSSYQFNVGPFLPGDCIGLDVVSTGGGATPSVGQGQWIFAKEFRVFSSTPNLSAGTAGNVFGEWVGIGTCTPFSNLYINGNNPALYDATVDSGQDGCGLTLTVRNNSTVTNSFAQLNLQVSGDSGRAVGRIALIRRDSATADMAFVTESENTKSEKMRIYAGGSVTKPLQPFVYGGLASDQTISTSNPTKVNFVANAGHFGCNVGGHWNNSTNQFTAPITGVYLVNLSGYWSSINMINQFAAFVNSARKVSIPTGYCTNIAGGSMMVPMASGETMDFRVYNDVGTGTLYQNVYHTFFSIYLLG